MNNQNTYQIKQNLKSYSHSFLDSVVVYNTYDGSTYQFNPIVDWLINIMGQQRLEIDKIQTLLEEKISSKEELQSHFDLLDETLKQLTALNLVECQCP